MPFWVPEDNNNCYAMLRPFYKKLDELEGQLDEELVACMSEQALPLYHKDLNKCNDHSLHTAKKFSYGRYIDYIPTKCFQGKLRIDRECGHLRSCCSSFNSCSFLSEESSTAVGIKELKEIIKKVAHQCETGQEINYSSDDDWSDHQPTGNITVKINSLDDFQTNFGSYRENSGYRPKFRVKFSDFGSLADDHKLKLGNVSKPYSIREDKFTKPKFHSPNDSTSGLGLKKLEISNDDGSLVLGRKSYRNHELHLHPKLSSVKIQEYKPEKENFDQLKKFAHANNWNKLVDAYRPTSSNTQISSVQDLFPGPNDIIRSELNMVGDSFEDSLFEDSQNFENLRPNGCGSYEESPKKQIDGFSRPKLKGVKTFKDMSKEEGEEEAKILKDLYEDWYKTVKEKLEKTKQNSKMPTLTLAYNNVINRLDHISHSIIKKLNKTTFDENDYPEKDAIIADRLCTPVEINNDRNRKNESIWKIYDGTKPEDIDFEKKYSPEEHWKEDPLAPKSPISGEINDLLSDWSKDELVKDLETFDSNMEKFKQELEPMKKKFTPCDHYLRCKHQMHISLDKCTALDQEKDNGTAILNAETLLSLKKDPCNGKNGEEMQELYELLIERNGNIRQCLNEEEMKNTTLDMCAELKSTKSLTDILVHKVFESKYENVADCFHDVNFIIERCSHLRTCCPDFDECREKTLNPDKEKKIMIKTALINQHMFDCINGISEKFDQELAKKTSAEGLTEKTNKREVIEKKSYITNLNLDNNNNIDLIDKWFPLPEIVV